MRKECRRWRMSFGARRRRQMSGREECRGRIRGVLAFVILDANKRDGANSSPITVSSTRMALFPLPADSAKVFAWSTSLFFRRIAHADFDRHGGLLMRRALLPLARVTFRLFANVPVVRLRSTTDGLHLYRIAAFWTGRFGFHHKRKKKVWRKKKWQTTTFIRFGFESAPPPRSKRRSCRRLCTFMHILCSLHPCLWTKCFQIAMNSTLRTS